MYPRRCRALSIPFVADWSCSWSAAEPLLDVLADEPREWREQQADDDEHERTLAK